MISQVHCKSSELYRAERIPTHTAQFRATIVVYKYLADRYSQEALQRHKERLKNAFTHLEQELQS